MFRLFFRSIIVTSFAFFLSMSGCSDRSTDANPSVSVTGSIINLETQQHIVGAKVSLVDAAHGDVLAQTTSDSTGSFRFDNQPRIKMYVLIEADGFNISSQTVFDPQKSDVKPTNISIQLSSKSLEPCCTGVFTLYIKDKNNVPIAGATVKIRKNGAVVKTLTSDADGKIIADGLCTGEYSILVLKDGYTNNEFPIAIGVDCAPVTKTITLVNGPCCSGVLTVSVKDNANNPIANATVKIYKNGALVGTQQTDAAGNTIFDHLCGGAYSGDATKDSYTHREFTFTINENCEPVTKSITLENGPCCSGVFTLFVKDKNGNPIVGATVKIFKGGNLFRTLQTNADGKIITDGLCAGDYGVDVIKEGYTHKEFTFTINTGCEPVTKDITLENGPCCSGVLTLTVKNANGDPVVGAVVKIRLNGVVIRTETTNADGKITVVNLCAGAYSALITKENVSKEYNFTINTNCDPVTDTVTLLTPCCSGVLTLTVTDNNGAPLVGATVKIYKGGAVLTTVTTGADGKAIVGNLCSGEYGADVTKDGYVHKEFSFTIDTQCNPVTKIISLENAPCCSGVFTLTVTKNDNTPIADANVKILKNGVVIKTGKTGSNGQFTADGLCAGEYRVSVTKDGFAGKEFSFTINTLCELVAKTIVLENGPCCSGQFTIHVRDINNTPIPYAIVKIYKNGVLIKTETTNADGDLTVVDLCKAVYSVNVTKDGYKNKEFTFEINLNCEPVTKTVNLDI